MAVCAYYGVKALDPRCAAGAPSHPNVFAPILRHPETVLSRIVHKIKGTYYTRMRRYFFAGDLEINDQFVDFTSTADFVVLSQKT